MTNRQEQIYDFIVDYMEKHLYAPSFREIRKGCGFASVSTLYTQLDKLQEQGLIKIEGSKSRCIRLIGFKLVREELLK